MKCICSTVGRNKSQAFTKRRFGIYKINYISYIFEQTEGRKFFEQ